MDDDGATPGSSVEPIPHAVTLQDVATAAGVSKATASRVLSGAGRVSDAAVTAVRGAAAGLGYRPNVFARALRSTTTQTTGMVVPRIGNPFFAELVEAVEDALVGVDQHLFLADSHDSVSTEAGRIASMIDRRVDGLIVVPVDHVCSAAAIGAAQSFVPVVQVDRSVDAPLGDFVGTDNAAGIRLLLDHLADQGCRTVTLVSGDDSTSVGLSRREAFHAVVGRLPGLRSGPEQLGEFSIEFGREAVRRLFRAGPPLPGALLCGSDVIALGAIRELLERGVAVPGDVLVTGFDGIHVSEIVEPALTTLKQPLRTVADEAIRLLTARLGGGRGAPQRLHVAPELVVRRSSRRPRPGT